ncbi:MAG: glycosyl transferase [Gorillibacterium sp.]|nr:glycosyl transferase [Gorillibacterium sp.]
MDNTEQIPRIVHYCWFGRGKKPSLVQKCMKTWQKHLSDYQFMEWNEDNFDINKVPFVRQAYEARKYAFVSDYVRLHALYQHGGVYMDTDVEVLKPLQPFLHHSMFSGFEDNSYVPAGLMAAVKEHLWIGELLDEYRARLFLRPDGSYDLTTNTTATTRNCLKHGLVANGLYQVLANGLTFYPRTYFSPYDYINGANYITENSYAIHHFAKSWLPKHVRLRSSIKLVVSRLTGPEFIGRMRKLLSPSGGKS